MRWIVNIEDKPQQRVLVVFNVLDDEIEYYGQYRIKTQWIDFSKAKSNSIDVSLEQIQEKLFEVSEKMNSRIQKHNDLNDSFKHIKTIQIISDDDEVFNDDNPYGFEPL